MAISRLITVEAVIRGYHENKIVWLNPVIKEELSCKWEMGNTHDTRAVAVRNIIDGDIKTVGHVPRKLSALRSILIRQGAWFNPCIVKGNNRRYSLDLPQHRWASIFSVENIYYLCSNPTNQSKCTAHYNYRARYCIGN